MVSNTRAIKFVSMSLLFIVTLMFIVVATTVSARAEENETEDSSATTTSRSTEEAKEKAEKLREELKKRQEKLAEERKKRMEEQQKKAEARMEASQKLAENKLQACEKREEAINKHMEKIVSRTTRQVEVFNKISERTQNFYKDKNLSLANYDVLVEDVNEKKAAVESAVNELKEKDVDFKCESEDPIGTAEGFKAARQEVVMAMKEYKTSIKNLIVGVKSVASTEKEGEDQ